MLEINNSRLVIEAGRSQYHYWQDLWRYRELLYYLAWRNILVRYRQTFMGITWAVIRPLLTMLVFTVIFGKLAKLPSDGVPYPILVFTAMLPWQFFASAFADAGNSLISSSRLISKIYFPRLVMPLSAMIVSLVDFIISFLILLCLMLYYEYHLSWRILTLPLFLLIAVLSTLAAALWIAALNVKYRDFRNMIPFIVQFGLYVSPIGFSSTIIPEKWRLIYSLNPLVGIIDGFRWAVLGGTSQIYWPGFILSICMTSIILVTAIYYFRKTENLFADYI